MKFLGMTIPTYIETTEMKYGRILNAIRADDEFAEPVKQQTGLLANDAAYLFEAVCREYKKNGPLRGWRRYFGKVEHHWGSSIFGPLLMNAGLITPSQDGNYEPTSKGLEIYRRHLSGSS